MKASDTEVGAAIERVDQQRGDQLTTRFVGTILLKEGMRPPLVKFRIVGRGGNRLPQGFDGPLKVASAGSESRDRGDEGASPGQDIGCGNLERLPRLVEAVSSQVLPSHRRVSGESGSTAIVSRSARSASE